MEKIRTDGSFEAFSAAEDLGFIVTIAEDYDVDTVLVCIRDKVVPMVPADPDPKMWRRRAYANGL